MLETFDDEKKTTAFKSQYPLLVFMEYNLLKKSIYDLIDIGQTETQAVLRESLIDFFVYSKNWENHLQDVDKALQELEAEGSIGQVTPWNYRTVVS